MAGRSAARYRTNRDSLAFERGCEFAEELSDRYMLTHYGPHSGNFVSFAAADKAEGQCLMKLFDEIGRNHGVTGPQVAGALGHNRNWTDWGESLSFLLVYIVAVRMATNHVWSSHPPADGWTAGIFLLIFCSLAFATGAVGLGENWVNLAEGLRIGTGHLGNRVEHSFFHHRMQLFGISLYMFCLIAAVSGWRNRASALSSLGVPESSAILGLIDGRLGHEHARRAR